MVSLRSGPWCMKSPSSLYLCRELFPLYIGWPLLFIEGVLLSASLLRPFQFMVLPAEPLANKTIVYCWAELRANNAVALLCSPGVAIVPGYKRD